MTPHHGAIPEAEPVEEAKLTENLGEFPCRFTEGDWIQAPMERAKARRVLLQC